MGSHGIAIRAPMTMVVHSDKLVSKLLTESGATVESLANQRQISVIVDDIDLSIGIGWHLNQSFRKASKVVLN